MKSTTPTQAIIPAAGLGTGMAPFSMAAGKELAPIDTIPAIQWILEEGAAAGIRHFAVITSPGKQALHDFLVGSFVDTYNHVEGCRRWLELRKRLNITIVDQKQPTGLGDALLLGWSALNSSLPIATLYPDNIISAATPLLPRLFEHYQSHGISIVATQEDQPFLLGNNYIVAGDQLEDTLYRAKAFTRKNDQKPGGTLWRAVGRAVLTPLYFEYLGQAAHGRRQAELDDVDGYQPLADSESVLITPPQATIHDAGSQRGYRKLWTALLQGELTRFTP